MAELFYTVSNTTNERKYDRYLAGTLLLVIDWFQINSRYMFIVFQNCHREQSLKPTKVLSIGVVLYGVVYLVLYIPMDENHTNVTSISP